MSRRALAAALALLSVASAAHAHVSDFSRLVHVPEPQVSGRAAVADDRFTPQSAPGVRREGPNIAQIDFKDVAGVYMLAGKNALAKDCAERIEIGELAAVDGVERVFGAGSLVVAHEKILVDGAACDAGGWLEVADIAEIAGDGLGGGGDSVVAQVAVAVDSASRVCGARTFSGVFQFYDDIPRYTSSLEDVAALPDGGLRDARAGEIYFPVVTGGDNPDDMDAPAAYCWYKNADKQTDVSGRAPFDGLHEKKPDPAKQSASKCFAADATVLLESGETRRMEELAVGDRVLAAGGSFTDVFMFTHKRSAGFHEFVELTAASRSVYLTPGHYIPLADGRLVAAAAVRVGDGLLLGDGTAVAVARSRRVQRRGLYNPQTISGDIVVDGIVTSTYTRAVEPMLAHTLLAPARAAFQWAGLWTSLFEDGFAGISEVLPGGPACIAAA
jgi:hypothetical protein